METEDIVYDSDSSKCSSVPKTKTRFPLLDEAYIQESDVSTSSAASKEIQRIPNIIVDATVIGKSRPNMDWSFEEPFVEGPDYVPGSEKSDEDINSTKRSKTAVVHSTLKELEAEDAEIRSRKVTSEDIVYDSDSSKCSSVPKTKTRFPLLDEAYIQESDVSTSSAASKEKQRIPKNESTTMVIDRSRPYLDSSFEEPYEDSGSEYIPGSEESDEEVTSTLQKKKRSETAVVNSKFKGLEAEDREIRSRDLKSCFPFNGHVHNEVPMAPNASSDDESFSDSENDKENSEKYEESYQEKDIIRLATNTTGKRTYDKKHACMFCKLLVSKLPRHLEAKHKNEKEVAEFMAQPLNSNERKQKIEDIRQTGNYLHNSEVITSGKGIVIPKRRPNSEKQVNDFTPCGYCHGFFSKKYFYAHKKQCADRHNVQNLYKSSGKMTFPVAEDDACKGLQQDVLSRMRQDDLYHVVRTDSLILRFGSELHKKLGNLEHLHGYISQRMRQLARFLIQIRNINKEISSLSDAIHPKYYNDFVKAMKCLGKYNEQNGSYGIPTLPLKLRTSIQQCAAIYKSELIIQRKSSKRAHVDDFVTLIEMNYRNQVASQALTSAHKTKWNKPEIIPLASDISILTTYLKEKGNTFMSLLKRETDAVTWVKLCEVTLVQTLLFNRRRSGEVERIYLETYKNRDQSAMNKEVENTLSDLEKQIAKNLTRIEVRGKKGRRVPILLPNDLKLQVDLLIETRESVGIPNDNPYLFASINSLKHLRSSDKLREITGKCGVKDPQSITSTKLRKHVATAAQLLNLKENEIDSLATYMGHDIRVHRQYYRLQDGVTQLTKVSKLLLAMDTDTLATNKNKNFDNMDIYGLDEHMEELQGLERMEGRDNIKNVESEFGNRDEPEPVKKKSKSAKQKSQKLQRDKRPFRENEASSSESESKNEDEPEPVKKKTKSANQKSKKVQRKKRPFRRLVWTNQEKDAMNRQMAVFWIRKKVPNKKECEECLSLEPELGRRRWTDVKNYVYNVIKKKGRN